MQTLSIPKRERILAIAFSPNGEHLAASCGDGHLRIWDLGTGTVVRSTPLRFPFNSISYLGDHRLILGGIFCWDLLSGTHEKIAPNIGGEMRISADGRYLAQLTALIGGGIVVRETTNWTPLPVTAEAKDSTDGLAFSPDGYSLATAHAQIVGQVIRQRSIVDKYDYFVHLREMPSAQVVRTIGGWHQRVTGLAFSPDGAHLAGIAGIRLRVWDLAADREAAHHSRGPKHFQGLAFTTDGRFLATVSNDTTVRIWDARSWAEHRTYTWQVGALLNIAFAPDGLRAAAGSDKGQIVIWDVD